jgi:hypothetical protein
MEVRASTVVVESHEQMMECLNASVEVSGHYGITTAVTVGGVPATNVESLSNQFVVFDVPPLPPVLADVVTTTPRASSSPWLFSTFEVT